MRPLLLLPIVLLLIGCTPSTDDACREAFAPYRDLVSGRARTDRNAPYLDAMARYRQGDYQGAADGLTAYLAQPAPEKSAYLYLAVSQLALGRPEAAELSIDHLEHSTVTGYADPCEWYTVLCWLCSGQRDRALEGARRIALRPHAFRNEAQRLVARLEREA